MKLKDFFKKEKKTTTPVVEEPKNPYYKGFEDGKHVFEADFNSYVDTASKEHPKDEDGNYINGRWDAVYVPEIEARSNHSLISMDKYPDTVTFTVDPKAIANYPDGAIYKCTRCSRGMKVSNTTFENLDKNKVDRYWNSGARSISMFVGLDLSKMIEDPDYACFVLKSFDLAHLNELGIGKIDKNFPNQSMALETVRIREARIPGVYDPEDYAPKNPSEYKKYMEAYEHAYTGTYKVGGVFKKDGILTVMSPEELDKLKDKGIKPTTPGSNGMTTGLKR